MPIHTFRRILTAGAGLLLLAAACSKPEEKESEPVVPVSAVQARHSVIQRIVTAQAILYPGNQSAIVPKISAPVRRFLVNRGDHVRRGQLLAELESRDLAAAAVEARGNLEQAEANLKSVSSASLPDELSKSRNDVRADKEALESRIPGHRPTELHRNPTHDARRAAAMRDPRGRNRLTPRAHALQPVPVVLIAVGQLNTQATAIEQPRIARGERTGAAADGRALGGALGEELLGKGAGARRTFPPGGRDELKPAAP